MNATANPFDHFWLCLLDGTIVPATDPLKCLLVSSSYVPQGEHTVLADVAAYEIAGAGYVAGGQSLSGVTVSRSGSVAKIDAYDLVFASLTATFRYAIIYADVTRNGKVKPLVGYMLPDPTPADIVVAGSPYTVVWAAAGVLSLGTAA